MSIPDVFDPYRKWLGIPPAEQPPNHYRLLGVGLFEDDADTIAGAADRQMAHVRTFQTGPHSALSQTLLNELASARLTLLNATKKATYDKQLRAKLAESAARADGAGQGSGAPAVAPATTSAPTAAPHVPPQPAPVAMAVAVPVAGQGRAGGGVYAGPAPIEQGEALIAASPSPRPRRRRSRQDPAMWLGVLVAVAALAAAVYYVRTQSEQESSHSVVATNQPSTHLDIVAPDVHEPHGNDNSSDGGAAQKQHGATAGDAQTEAAEMPDDEHERSATDNAPEVTPVPPKTVATMPSQPASATEPPSAQPRTLADLANLPEGPRLAQPRRETPPEGKSLAAATARFKQQYGKDIAAAKTPEARRNVELRIWHEARDGSKTADLRYLMLDNVGKEEVSRGSVGLAYRLAVEVARQFDVDELAIKLKALEASAKTAQTPEAFAIGTLQALSLADRAAREGKLDVANKAAGQAGLFARKTKDKDLISQTDRRKAGLREQSAHYAAYKKALTELKKSPEDRDANLTAGKYEMLVLGEWRDALAKLLVSGNARLAEVARLEVEARADPSQWVPLVAAWWQAAQEEADDYYKRLTQLQAKYCYLRARKLGRAGGVATEIAEQLKALAGYPMSRLLPGAAARYYDGAAFEREKLQRADPAIDFPFGQNSPDPSVSTDFFSARWTGFFKPPVSGRYQIATFTDNSVRLWVDGKEVLNRWGPGVAGWQQAELELTDEPHTFRFEFNDTIGAAVAMFGWTLAAFPDDQHAEKSPIDALYYDPESPFDLPELGSQ